MNPNVDQAIAAAREALAYYEGLAECNADYDPCAHEITGKLADLLAALAVPAERLGEQCADGGKCHHACTERCFRREHCGPFSDYTGPWAYEQAQQPAAAVPAAHSFGPGIPPRWFDEWFIAKTVNGERVVLRSLPEEHTYDYTTADGTYFRADRIKAWMQFPDSEYVALTESQTQHPAAAVPEGYVPVPVEPTPEMIAAGWFGGEMHIALGHANAYRECEGYYARLLAAANKENTND